MPYKSAYFLIKLVLNMKKTKKLVIGFCVAILFGGTFILSLALMVSCSQKLPDAPISSNSVKASDEPVATETPCGYYPCLNAPTLFLPCGCYMSSSNCPSTVICPNGTATPIPPAPTNTFTPVPSLTALSNTPTITWSATITPSPNLTQTPLASPTCNPNAQPVPISEQFGYTLPLGTNSVINNALSYLPFPVQLENVSWAFQGTEKDCCLNGNNFPSGDIEQSGNIGFDLTANSVPFGPAISINQNYNLGFAKASISIEGGVIGSMNTSIAIQGGQRNNQCTNAICGFGSIGANFSPTIQLEISSAGCIEFVSGEDPKTCTGFTIVPAGINNSIGIAGTWDLNTCNDGVDVAITVSDTEAFAKVTVGGWNTQVSWVIIESQNITLNQLTQ